MFDFFVVIIRSKMVLCLKKLARALLVLHQRFELHSIFCFSFFPSYSSHFLSFHLNFFVS